MNITLQYPWFLLLILPTVPLIVWRALRAGFTISRATLYGLMAAGLIGLMAAPVHLPRGDKIPAVYLIDCSASIARPQDEIVQLGSLSGGAHAAELERFSESQAWLFGGKVLVSPSLGFDATQINASVEPSNSRYATSLGVLQRYATDHPDGCALLIGDGLAQDLPEALARAAELRRLGWTLDVMPGPAAALDYGIVAVDTPAVTPPGQAAPVRVRVQANAAGVAQVELQLLDRDGKTVARDSLPVTFSRASEQAVTFTAKMDRPGVYRVVARVRPSTASESADGQPGNDFGYQLLTVRADTIAILHVVDDAKPSAWGIQTKYLAEHFPELHWTYQAMTPKRFAAVGAVPRETRLLVLENIAAADLPVPLWRSVNEFVQVEAGGLLALGGDKAFGAGEHKPGGDLERCLPIRMEPPKNRRIDIVLVIDVSASMADSIVESAVKTAKLDAAKEAVWGLLGGQSLLGEDDRIALITFSGETDLKLPFTPVKEALTIKEKLAAMEAQGSTKPAPAVAKAFDLVTGTKADRTFIVFVTDGQPSTNGPEDVNFASGQNAAIIDLLRKNIPDTEPPAAAPKLSFWPVFIGDEKGTDRYRRSLAEYAKFGKGKLIWPQAASHAQPGELDATSLAGALKKILDEGNKDRFTSDAPFLVGATGQAHPLAPLLASSVPFGWRNRVGIKPDGILLWQAAETAASATPAGSEPTPAVAGTLKKPEPLFAAGQYGNGRSAAVAMRFSELALQARKENPHLADQMIAQIQWLTGAGELQTAVVEWTVADTASANALHVPVGEPVLQFILPPGDSRNGSSQPTTTPQENITPPLFYAVQRIPMAEASAVPWNAQAAGVDATGTHGQARWISPSRFAAPWTPADSAAGVYAVELSTLTPAMGSTSGQLQPRGRFTLAIPASAEYLQNGISRDRLQALATAGGGALMDGVEAADQWRWRVENQWRASLSKRMAREGEDLRPWLALLLAALLIADSALRWLKPVRPVATSSTRALPAPATTAAAAPAKVGA